MMCVDVDDDARVIRDRVCDALVPQKRVDKIGQLSRLAEAHLQGHRRSIIGRWPRYAAGLRSVPALSNG